MKRLISEEEICDCINTNTIFNLNKYVPVEIAEERIKNIAIAFADWHISMFIITKSLWRDKTTSELFEKFLSTRE